MSDTAGDRLRRAAEQCRNTSDPDLVWLGETIGEALEHQAAGQPTDLDGALGLNWGSRLRRRDDAIAEVDRRHFAEFSIAAAASAIGTIAASLQRRKCGLIAIPLDDPRALIAKAIRTGLPIPRRRRLEDIIKAARQSPT